MTQSPHMLKVTLVFGRGQLQMLFLGAAAVHDALQAASEAAWVAAMHPMAQLGFWHELPAPTQQCPATLHLASQLGSSACTPSTRTTATVARRMVGTIADSDDQRGARCQCLSVLKLAYYLARARLIRIRARAPRRAARAPGESRHTDCCTIHTSRTV